MSARRYSVRPVVFEEGGSIFIVKGPRMPDAGYAASTRAAAFELVARAETRRLCGATWRARKGTDGVIRLVRRMHREQVVPFHSWEQAALFLMASRAVHRRGHLAA